MRSWRVSRNISSLVAIPIATRNPFSIGEAKQSACEAHCSTSATDKFADIDARTKVIKQGLAPKRIASGCGGPLFRFGVIADIQHADIPDALNFSGKEMRQYRGSLTTVREAIRHWEENDVLFVAQLGDLIDGQNAGKYGDGLKFAEPQSWTAIQRVLDELCRLNLNVPYLHAIGNHELYNFSYEDLKKLMGISGPIANSKVHSPSPLYYSFSPHPGWRIVMLNGYELSVSLPEGSDGRIKAERLLRANHPHADALLRGQGKLNYFEGLSGMNQRFVPFNGAFGEEQLHWLSSTLKEAKKDNERVIILTHLPLHPLSVSGQEETKANAKNLAYDAPEALRIIWEHGASCVAAVLAGHCHPGGHYSEPSTADHLNLMNPLPGEPGNVPPTRAGVHHVTLQAALTHKHAYGHIDVYRDHLELVGVAPLGMEADDARKAGFIPSRKLMLEPLSTPL